MTRLSKASLDCQPHRSLGIGSGFGPMSVSMPRTTFSILGPPAACIVLRMSACRRRRAEGQGPGPVVVGPPAQGRPSGNHHQEPDHSRPVLDV
jgi:hypothetical protein